MNNNQQLAYPRPPIPVKTILLKGLIAPGVNIRPLLRVAAPMLMTFAAALVFGASVGTGSQMTFSLPVAAAFVVVIVITAVMAAVGCHRIFILGPGSVKDYGLFWFGQNEARFLGWWLKIALLSILVILPVWLILGPVVAPNATVESLNDPFSPTGLVLIALQIFAMYFFCRWSVVLPATATEFREEMSLSWAWQLTQGNEWRLLLMLGVLPIGIDLLTRLLPALNSGVFGVVMVLVGLYIVAAEIAILSFSFEYLVGANKNQQAEDSNQLSE